MMIMRMMKSRKDDDEDDDEDEEEEDDDDDVGGGERNVFLFECRCACVWAWIDLRQVVWVGHFGGHVEAEVLVVVDVRVPEAAAC